jgi:hypothetical protein
VHSRRVAPLRDYRGENAWVKNSRGGHEKDAPNTDKEKEIERLRTSVVVRASHLEQEIEQANFAKASFDATTTRGALKLLRTAASADKHENAAA